MLNLTYKVDTPIFLCYNYKAYSIIYVCIPIEKGRRTK